MRAFSLFSFENVKKNNSNWKKYIFIRTQFNVYLPFTDLSNPLCLFSSCFLTYLLLNPLFLRKYEWYSFHVTTPFFGSMSISENKLKLLPTAKEMCSNIFFLIHNDNSLESNFLSLFLSALKSSKLCIFLKSAKVSNIEMPLCV